MLSVLHTGLVYLEMGREKKQAEREEWAEISHLSANTSQLLKDNAGTGKCLGTQRSKKQNKKKDEGIQEEGFLKINIFSFLVIEYPLPLTSKGRTARASMVQCAV